MDFLLDDHQKDLQRRARAFFDQVLEPMELGGDVHGGFEEQRPRIRQAVRDTDFAGINHSLDDGDHGFFDLRAVPGQRAARPHHLRPVGSHVAATYLGELSGTCLALPASQEIWMRSMGPMPAAVDQVLPIRWKGDEARLFPGDQTNGGG